MNRSAPTVIALVLVWLTLTACGSSSTATSPPTTAPPRLDTSVPASTTPAASGPFTSKSYGYAVNSAEWTGTSGTSVWDGSGAPGHDEPVVDSLRGPKWERSQSVLPSAEQVWAMAAPTSRSLDQFVSDFRTANVTAHGCSPEPAKRTAITIDGEPAVLDEDLCPADAPVFALTATVVHAGHGYIFFTFAGPEFQDAMRAWFQAFLPTVKFQ